VHNVKKQPHNIIIQIFPGDVIRHQQFALTRAPLTCPVRKTHLQVMRRGFLILLFLILALPLTSLAQSIVTWTETDHSWVIKCGTNRFGLEQTTQYLPDHGTETSVLFGSRMWTFHTTVWPILAIMAIALSPFLWLAIYGIGSFARRPKKHPPPVASPP
jgi:hypothetical protein